MFVRKILICTLITLVVSLVLISASLAQDTLLISYQGRLTDVGGNPITGTPSMTFTIYNGSGASKWAESHPSVQVDDGLFNVILGSQSALPDSVFTGDDRYLGITVSGDPEISPRALLTSAPGAAVAKKVAGDVATEDGVLNFYDPTGSFPDDPAMKMGTEPSPFIEMTEQSLGFGDRPMMRMGVEPTPFHQGYISFRNPEVDPPPSLFDLGIITDGSEWSSSIDMYFAHPPEYPSPKQILSIGSAPSTGASFRMFNPQPEPPALFFELNANTGAGPTMSFYDEYGQVMGFDPTPFNEGFSMYLYDPTENENRLEINSNYNTDESSIKFIDPGNDGVTPSIELGTNPSNTFFRISRYDQPTSMLYEGFSFNLDNINQSCNFRLIDPGNDDIHGFEMNASELTSDATFRLIAPNDNNKSLIALSGNSTGASVKMFNPQPEPPALYFELTSSNTAGPSMSFFDDVGKTMGVEPTPFNQGIALNFFDPQEDENRVVITSNYSTDESSIKFIDPGDDGVTPIIEMAVSPTGNLFNFGLVLSGDAMQPGVEMTTDASSATMMMGSGPGAPQTVMSFITDNSEARIGIGIDSPTEPLVVGKNVTSYPGTWAVIGDDTPGETTGLIIGESANSHSWLEWSINGNRLSLGTRENTTWYSNTLNLKGGNIGINITTPSEPLVVGKDLGSFTGNRIVIGDDGVNINTGLEIGEHSDFRGFVLWRGDHNYLNIGTEEDGVLFDNSLTVRTGQVGIGTGTPLQTLDVRGTIGNASTVYHSDKRWKRDIQELKGSLNRVLSLQGVQYKWKQAEYPEMNFPDGEQIGLIAQDVEKIIPEVVNEASNGYKSLDYAKLVSVLIESIKEQQEQIEVLSHRVEELEGMKVSGR